MIRSLATACLLTSLSGCAANWGSPCGPTSSATTGDLRRDLVGTWHRGAPGGEYLDFYLNGEFEAVTFPTESAPLGDRFSGTYELRGEVLTLHAKGKRPRVASMRVDSEALHLAGDTARQDFRRVACAELPDPR